VKQYILDGAAFSTLEGFAKHFSAQVLVGHVWQGNLDAFDDILRGGFGTPEEGFCLIWKNSNASRHVLSYGETTRQLELRLQHCHASNRLNVGEQLAAARRGEGSTVFDWLIEIIEDHGPNGTQSEDHVELRLE
jgi:RNAse (barnase) inhibitor barstar